MLTVQAITFSSLLLLVAYISCILKELGGNSTLTQRSRINTINTAMRSSHLWTHHLGSVLHGFPLLSRYKDTNTESCMFVFLHKVPEMAEEFLENSVLTLNCLHNNLHHVRAVTVGMIWKGHQSPYKYNTLQWGATVDTNAQHQRKSMNTCSHINWNIIKKFWNQLKSLIRPSFSLMSLLSTGMYTIPATLAAQILVSIRSAGGCQTRK